MPPITASVTEPERELPAFHFRAYHLDSSTDLFFDFHSPLKLLAHSVNQVLLALYPSNQPHLPLRSITLFLEEFDGVAFTQGSRLDEEHKEIHLSTSYLEKIAKANLSKEIEGVILHELVHCLQFTCGAPSYLIEGIADWVRLKSGLAPPHWKKSGGPISKFYSGYQDTAYLLDYISEKTQSLHMVPLLNLELAENGWNDGKAFSKFLMGRSVEEWWTEYCEYLGEGMAGEEQQAV